MMGRVVMLLAVSATVLGACAHSTPQAIHEAPVPDPGLAQVRQAPSRYESAVVRWGGNIVAVENRVQDTWLQILGRPVEKNGRPDSDKKPEGRFIAQVKGFLDPAEYANNRLVTVAGRVMGVVERQVGEYPYPHVQVEVDTLYLWPRPRQRSCCPGYPWHHPWYDPWYDPWYYPWRYRPYRW
jgi:outer membrane lipoprotein